MRIWRSITPPCRAVRATFELHGRGSRSPGRASSSAPRCRGGDPRTGAGSVGARGRTRPAAATGRPGWRDPRRDRRAHRVVSVVRAVERRHRARLVRDVGWRRGDLVPLLGQKAGLRRTGERDGRHRVTSGCTRAGSPPTARRRRPRRAAGARPCGTSSRAAARSSGRPTQMRPGEHVVLAEERRAHVLAIRGAAQHRRPPPTPTYSLNAQSPIVPKKYGRTRNGRAPALMISRDARAVCAGDVPVLDPHPPAVQLARVRGEVAGGVDPGALVRRCASTAMPRAPDRARPAPRDPCRGGRQRPRRCGRRPVPAAGERTRSPRLSRRTELTAVPAWMARRAGAGARRTSAPTSGPNAPSRITPRA